MGNRALGTSASSYSDCGFCLAIAEDYEQLVEDIVRDGRLYASENHQEILKVSESPPAPLCLGLGDLQHARAHLGCATKPPCAVAPRGGAQCGMVTHLPLACLLHRTRS